MAEHPNLAVFREIYTTFTSGDMDALAEYFDENVVWHTPGSNPLSETYRGRDATFSSFEQDFELSSGTYDVTVRDALASDDVIVALLHATAERQGRKLDQDYAIVFHILDGRVDEAWEVWTDQAAVDEFWS